MPARHRTHRHACLKRGFDDPRLVIERPAPPPFDILQQFDPHHPDPPTLTPALRSGFSVERDALDRGPHRRRTIKKRLRQFRKPHCGSIRIDETYIKVRGERRYLYRAIDKHGDPVDFLHTANRDLDAAKRFFRKMLADHPLLAPDRIGTDGAGTYSPAIAAAKSDGLLSHATTHYVTMHLQQGIEIDRFRVKQAMPRVGGFRSFNTARRTICGFEAML